MAITDLLSDGKVGNLYFLSFAETAVGGGISGATSGVVAGYVGTSATTAVTVRATTYTPQGTDSQRSVSSTSASDTAAGVGARTIKITYLDAACTGPYTETIALNGVTPVNTVNTNIALIERIDVETVGSSAGNVGTIRIHTATAGGGSIWGSISASDNATYWAHHYVPANKTMFLTSLQASAQTVAGRLTINTLNPLDTTIVQKNPAGTLRYGSASTVITFQVPVVITGPAIVFLNTRPDANTASTSFASFGYIDF